VVNGDESDGRDENKQKQVRVGECVANSIPHLDMIGELDVVVIQAERRAELMLYTFRFQRQFLVGYMRDRMATVDVVVVIVSIESGTCDDTAI
jgi:hypothetical protein